MLTIHASINKPRSATIDNFLNWCITLKNFTGDLGQYLMKRGLLKTFYTFCELLCLFKELIRDDNNFDPNNPSIILADPELEKALGRRAIFVKEIRHILLEHVKLAEPGPDFRPTLAFRTNQNVSIVGTPINYLDQGGTPYKAYLFSPDLITHANYIGPVTIGLLKATLPNGFSISFGNRRGTTLCSIRCLKTILTDHELDSFFELVEQIETQAKNGTLSKNKPITQARQALLPPINNMPNRPHGLDQPTSPSPKLLALLQSFKGQASKELFTFKEVRDLIVQYIFSREDEFFDRTGGHIALVENDPLGKIFKLKAFHRSQLGELLHQQLAPPPLRSKNDKKPPTDRLKVSNMSGNYLNGFCKKINEQKERGKCFGCNNPSNKYKVFCNSCWQVRKKIIGPEFHISEIKNQSNRPTRAQKKKNKTKPRPLPRKKNNTDGALCKICFQKEAEAGFLHGKIFHLFGCFNCCREIYLASKPCPICRGVIDKIIIKYES